MDFVFLIYTLISQWDLHWLYQWTDNIIYHYISFVKYFFKKIITYEAYYNKKTQIALK